MRTLARLFRAWADWLDCGCQPPHYLVLCKKHGQKVETPRCDHRGCVQAMDQDGRHVVKASSL